MGDAADHANETDLDRELFPFGIDVLISLPNRNKRREAIAECEWTTRNGRKIKFRDMGLAHLRNVVRMVREMNAEHADYLDDYYAHRVMSRRRTGADQ